MLTTWRAATTAEARASDWEPLIGSPDTVVKETRSWVSSVDLVKFIYFGEVCWVVSEVFWILLVPLLCVPFGALASLSVAFVSIVDVCTGQGTFANSLALMFQTVWLLINFVWMLEEVLWDSPDEQTPWKLTPMRPEDESLYNQIQSYCAVGFFAVPATWVVVMLGACFLSKRWRRDDSHPVRMIFFSSGYLATWALMDALWAFGLLWSSLFSCVVTVFLILATGSEETGLGLRGVDRTDFVWILWTISNFFWIACEQFDGNLEGRYVAAGFGSASVMLLLCSFEQVRARQAC